MDVLVPTRYNQADVDAPGHVAKLALTSYVVDDLKCLLYAFWICIGSFEEAVVYAVNLDTAVETAVSQW